MATEPAYDTVIRRIERLRIPETTIWLAEYGDTNHTWCATIFANASDRTIVRSIGERIYNRGGMDALQANFYILCHGFIAHGRPERARDGPERAQHVSCMREIGMAWNGIAEWRM